MVGFPPFIQEFFLDPICNYSGYNFVNTLTYGIILIGIAFYLVFPFFNKRGIRFDFRFGLAVLAFVLFGSTLRILEDLKILGRSCNPFEPGFLTVTPGIYVAVGLLAIAALIFSIWLAKKIKQETIKVFGAIGTLLAAPFVLFDKGPPFAKLYLYHPCIFNLKIPHFRSTQILKCCRVPKSFSEFFSERANVCPASDEKSHGEDASIFYILNLHEL